MGDDHDGVTAAQFLDEILNLGCGFGIESRGRLKLFHLDLYRLETAQQILSAGIEDYLSPDGVSVIEWAERLAKEELRMQNAETKRRMLSVCIEILSETERKIIYEDFL